MCCFYSTLNACGYLFGLSHEELDEIYNDMILKIHNGQSAMDELHLLLTEGSDRLPFCCLEGTPYELSHKRIFKKKKNRPETHEEAIEQMTQTSPQELPYSRATSSSNSLHGP